MTDLTSGFLTLLVKFNIWPFRSEIWLIPGLISFVYVESHSASGLRETVISLHRLSKSGRVPSTPQGTYRPIIKLHSRAICRHSCHMSYKLTGPQTLFSCCKYIVCETFFFFLSSFSSSVFLFQGQEQPLKYVLIFLCVTWQIMWQSYIHDFKFSPHSLIS